MPVDVIGTNPHESTLADLADAIDGVLAEHNLGVINRESLSVKRGRNLSCTFTTTEFGTCFAKRVIGNDQFKASMQAANLIVQDPGSAGQGSLRTPRLIDSSTNGKILIFEGVPNADNVATILQENTQDDEQVLRLMDSIGAGLRQAHKSLTNADDLNEEPSPLPPISHFEQLPWSSFESFSAASLQVWGRLQKDKELYHAVVSLREMENTDVKVPIHGDLRFDQFLFDDDEDLWLIDWEEFRLGHPGRDLGGLIGEWLHIAFSSLLGETAVSHNVEHVPQTVYDEELTHEEIVARGQEALNRVMPNISALWNSYLGQNTTIQNTQELATITAAFAGWHLYDRLLAASELAPRVSALSWAAAGIGRNILLNPAEAAKNLGLTGSL